MVLHRRSITVSSDLTIALWQLQLLRCAFELFVEIR
jgi:hypothetical protein